VQHNPADAFSTRRILTDAFTPPPDVEHVTTFAGALARLRAGDLRVVLLDLRLPDADGVEACARVLHEAPALPLVVLTELADESEAESAVMLGAHDYLVKGRFTAGGLGRSIRYAVERHRLQSQVEELSLSDALTGLSNRRGFVVLAEDDVRRARRSGTPFVLGVADVDGLTAINAAHGRLEGDRAIREAAGILRRTFRDSDVVARVGGDEFAVLLREATPECQEEARRRLASCLEEHNRRRPHRRWRLAIALAFPRGTVTRSGSVDDLLAALPGRFASAGDRDRPRHHAE
jgi:diguanylate cyclase (GGDEF)-like protein